MYFDSVILNNIQMVYTFQNLQFFANFSDSMRVIRLNSDLLNSHHLARVVVDSSIHFAEPALTDFNTSLPGKRDVTSSDVCLEHNIFTIDDMPY